MSDLDTFKKWFKIITGTQLDQFDMDLLIKDLLPGYSFGRSGHGPRANKFIYYPSGELFYKHRLNEKVGMQALREAANTDYKKAILEVYDTKIKINSLLDALREKIGTFDTNVIVDKNKIDICLYESD